MFVNDDEFPNFNLAAVALAPPPGCGGAVVVGSLAGNGLSEVVSTSLHFSEE